MRKSFLIISFFALSIISFSVSAQEKEKPVEKVSSDSLGDVDDAFQEYFFEALKQKAIENYDKAVEALLKCLSMEQKPVVYLELGKNFNALHQFEEAAAYLETGRKKVPKNTAILEELYKSYFLSRNFEKALPVVNTLAFLDTTFSEDLVNLQIINENFDEALKLMDSLDAKKGASTSRDSLRRQVYSRTNNVEAQLKDLKEKIAEDPADEKSYLNLIFVYSENDRSEEAFEAAKKLLEMNPDSELVHLALYKFHLNENETEEAIESMKILLSSKAIDESTKYQALNDFLLYVSENPIWEEELIKLAVIFSKEENNTRVYGQLGTFFLEKRKKEQALKYFQRALEADRDNYGLYRDVLDLQLEFNKNEEAVITSDKALEVFPSQALLYLYKGKALNALEKYREAEESLLFGLEYLIEDEAMELIFYKELTKAYTGLNDPEKAAQYRKMANEPDN